MKKLSLGAALVSALALSSGAHAAFAVGATGTINFNGSINAESCTVATGGTVSSGVINVPMGAVSSLALGTEDAPAAMRANGLPVRPQPLDLALTCATGTKVQLALTPLVASGKGIGTVGSAVGAQITLMRDDVVVDLGTAAGRLLEATLVANKADIRLVAYYTTKGVALPASVTPGTANATLNYTLSYE